MSGQEISKEELLRQVESLRLENEQLKSQIVQKDTNIVSQNGVSSFSLEEYKRYGRQMIVPLVGIEGQIKLKQSKILVIGAGGLGCPLLLYLTAAGVGKIAIVDNDVVDVSNLHRQVLHTTDNVGMTKCDSLKKYLSKLNPFVELEVFNERLTNENVFSIFTSDQWDLVLDCTDTPLTRYLINDAAVITGLTIVSGSGVKTDGQLSLLNFMNIGPCYRCFYPKPPPLNSVLSCKDGGVIGPAIGVMGTMMALELIKVICGEYTRDDFKPFLNLYSGVHNQSLRVFKMRGKNAKCEACGETPSVTRAAIETNEINYSEWCGKMDYNVVKEHERVSVKVLAEKLQKDEKLLLLDVRPLQQFQICHLPGSIHKDYDELVKEESLAEIFGQEIDPSRDVVYCICRYGNDSRLTTRLLRDKYGVANVYDVVGGLNKWSELVDPNFPQY